jgi:geranylgeranyl pyrophosphate synthase
MRVYQGRVESALERSLDSEQHPRELVEAMRYAVLGGGKRVRPVLVYATGTALGAPIEALDAPACAIELIHAYSLVHDDLPAMDDDDMRRGKPTCHKAFGEAMAILAGDALQALAFEVLARESAALPDASARLRMVQVLGQAAGVRGMVGGQALDLGAQGRALTLEELEQLHLRKTGALIRASVRLGALSSVGLSSQQVQALDDYASCIGLAFQIRDDILDMEGDMGPESDAPLGTWQKPSYPALLGIDGALQRALALHKQALASLSVLDARADPLRWLSAFIIQRAH